jgi:hypothetical protein
MANEFSVGKWHVISQSLLQLCFSQEDDVNYFTYRDVNSHVVSVILAQSLEELVDSDSPQNVLKFRLVCDYSDGEDTVSF